MKKKDEGGAVRRQHATKVCVSCISISTQYVCSMFVVWLTTNKTEKHSSQTSEIDQDSKRVQMHAVSEKFNRNCERFY